mmetsp:Transcript_26439/g.55311  ORF Transcript_26439/g.55311 Transcript_26439/m.55311 type:complete len:217 (+) Transcript_26439:1414-2064(+)
MKMTVTVMMFRKFPMTKLFDGLYRCLRHPNQSPKNPSYPSWDCLPFPWMMKKKRKKKRLSKKKKSKRKNRPHHHRFGENGRSSNIRNDPRRVIIFPMPHRRKNWDGPIVIIIMAIRIRGVMSPNKPRRNNMSRRMTMRVMVKLVRTTKKNWILPARNPKRKLCYGREFAKRRVIPSMAVRMARVKIWIVIHESLFDPVDVGVVVSRIRKMKRRLKF